MRANSRFIVFIFSTGLLTVFLLQFGGCGGASSDSTKYLAKNVIIGSAAASALKSQSDNIDTETEVLAENVIVNTENNVLSATNLQDALDQELATDLSANIVGVWSVENIEYQLGGVTVGCVSFSTQEPQYNAPGTVVFRSDGTYAMCSGRFAVEGLEFGTTRFVPTTYAVKDKGTIILNLIYSDNNSSASGPAIVSNSTVNSITLLGNGTGCGSTGGIRYSKLTRISTGATCP